MHEPTIIHFYTVDEDENAWQREYCTGNVLTYTEDHVLWDMENLLREWPVRVTCPQCLSEWTYSLAGELALRRKREEREHKRGEEFSKRLKFLLKSWRDSVRKFKDYKTADEVTQLLEDIP